MKRLVAALLVVISSVAVNAQTEGAKTSIELGAITVWLGMPKQELLRRCTKAGYKVAVEGLENDLKILDSEKLTTASNIFRVGLKDDKVTFASRDWYSANAGPFDAVLGALEQLTTGGQDTLCFVGHTEQKSPDNTGDKVSIVCGARSVIIMNVKTKGMAVAAVYEEISTEKR
jgi:hypothetical protein